MMRNLLEYKGYHTKIEFDTDTMTLRGKIEGINDYVDFEATDISDIEKEFHSAVDDYIEFCKEVGKEPEKEYKGTFNIRIAPELHKKLALCALNDDCSLNAEVEKAISLFVANKQFQFESRTKDEKDLTETISMDKSQYENETTVYSNNVISLQSVKHIYKDEVETL